MTLHFHSFLTAHCCFVKFGVLVTPNNGQQAALAVVKEFFGDFLTPEWEGSNL